MSVDVTAAEFPAHPAYDAGRLIAFALRPKLVPAHNDDYASLARRYRTDVRFRELVDGLAGGLGLVPLDAGDYGLVLGAVEGSVFAWRLDDYRANLTIEDRLLHGLVQLGIAAFCFPNAESLDPDEERVVHTVTAHAVERDLRETCQRLDARLGVGDVPEASPEMECAVTLYLARAGTRDTKVRARTTTLSMIQYALERLADQGLLTCTSDANGGTYKTRARYHIHCRELAAFEGFRALAAARRSTGGV